MKNKAIWALSQGTNSAFYFLLQLYIFKHSNISIVVQYASLSGIGMFFIILYRRIFLEIRNTDIYDGGRSPLYELTFVNSIISLFLTYYFKWNFYLTVLLLIMQFFMALLDEIRFGSNSGNKYFSSIQILCIVVLLILEYIKFDTFEMLITLNLITIVIVKLGKKLDNLQTSHNLKNSKYMNYFKLADHFFASSIGFFAPTLIAIILKSQDVASLRTSQNLLSIGSIITAAYYYDHFSNKKLEFSKSQFIFPTLIMISLVLCISVFPNRIRNIILGPYTVESLPLSLILSLNMFFVLWISSLLAQITKKGGNRSILKVHIFTGLTYLILIIWCVNIFNLIGFGIATLLTSFLEISLLSKEKKKVFKNE